MPMLTPIVILELNAMMQTIELAVIEVSNFDQKTANRQWWAAWADELSQFSLFSPSLISTGILRNVQKSTEICTNGQDIS